MNLMEIVREEKKNTTLQHREKESVYDKSCESYSQVKKDAKEYRIAGAQTRITNTRWLNAS